MPRDAPTSTLGKMNRGILELREGPLWAARAELQIPISQKRTLAAVQKTGKMGSNLPFAARSIKVR